MTFRLPPSLTLSLRMPPLSENIARLNITESQPDIYKFTEKPKPKVKSQLPFFHSKKKTELIDSATLYPTTHIPVGEPLSGTEADDEKTENSDLSFPHVARHGTINMGRKVFIPEGFNNTSIDPPPLRLPELAPSGTTNTEYATLLESYNDLLTNHRLVLNEFQKVSSSIDDIVIENRQHSNEIQNTYSEALRNQSDFYQEEIKSLRFQLSKAQSALLSLEADQGILIQWVKSLFSELERASKSGELSTQLKVNASSIAKLLQHPPIDGGKLQLIYRSFVESLSFKSTN